MNKFTLIYIPLYDILKMVVYYEHYMCNIHRLIYWLDVSIQLYIEEDFITGNMSKNEEEKCMLKYEIILYH